MFAGSGLIKSGFDADARRYIDAVEDADGARLEFEVRRAINVFVVGCKSDGIWDAIKASCIMAGAKTLAGALVPLAGVAPINFNFVAGDYNRKIGLKGNGFTKYLNSNRNSNADPQDSYHLSVFISTQSTQPVNSNFIAAGDFQTGGSSALQTAISGQSVFARSRNSNGVSIAPKMTGFFGTSRSTSNTFNCRFSSTNTTLSSTSQTPVNDNVFVFRGNAATPGHTDARLAFYSIGEFLDLSKLDTRITTLMNDFNLYIP